MATQALLLCRDPDVVGVLRPILDELGLGPEVCSQSANAHALLRQRKYNPVIVDCEQMDADGELLRSLRQSPANGDAIALGIIGNDVAASAAFALGANLILRKPVDTAEAGRTLRTALALVTRMRRRFLRHVLHTLACVRVEGMRDSPMLLDIGEGGIAIQALDQLEKRRAFSLHFTLPGDAEEFEAVAASVWSDASGRAGLRFLGMPAASRRRLKQWLDARGAAGPADLAPEDLPDGPEERVRFPLQLAPAAHAACAIVMDLLMICAALAVFAVVCWTITGETPPAPAGSSAFFLLGCACWLLYRYIVFGGLSMTPGGHMAAALADRILVWIYNRQRDTLPLPNSRCVASIPHD